MAEFKNLSVGFKGGIMTVTISRIEKMNALNQKTLEEIKRAIQKAYDEDNIRAVIFTGAGEKAFVAGADISEIAELTDVNARKFAENGQEIFEMIEMCPKPVIAAVNGYALGGGCELALSCHMRVAAENARFGLPEVGLGIIPGYGGTQRITQLVGKGKAFELIMTGEMITAKEALELGLVNYVTSQEDLISKCEEILAKILLKAPIAIAQVVECINAVYNEEEDGYQTEANSFSICVNSEDFLEGTKAFLEKRKANFKGA